VSALFWTMKTRVLLGLLPLLAPAPTSGQFVEIRVSAHVIVHPTTGARPAGITDNVFYIAAANANLWMARYYRGYRFRITEITNVGGPSQGGSSGPSKWFGLDFRDTPEPWNTFQNETQSDIRYQLRSDQVNFYIATDLAGGGGGACPIPPVGASQIACQGFVNTGPFWLVHETGHFFGLSHTHGGCGCPSTDGCVLTNGFWVGDDGIADTLPEGAGDFCFTTRDHLARANFNKFYTSCTPVEQALVDDTFFNVMSYHLPDTKDQVEDRMTELQLDLHADTANSSRASFVSGSTVFVRTFALPFLENGSSRFPFDTVAEGVSAASANGTDIVLLRGGNYNERLTINKRVTLRATRTGWATIGKP